MELDGSDTEPTWNGPGFFSWTTTFMRSFRSKAIRAKLLQATMISGGVMAASAGLTDRKAPRKSTRMARIGQAQSKNRPTLILDEDRSGRKDV
jgi:hypothetical protein